MRSMAPGAARIPKVIWAPSRAGPVAQDDEISCLDEKSTQIGFRRNTRPSICQIPLEIGLTVVVYTDGLVHAGSRTGQNMDVRTCLHSLLDERDPPPQELADGLLEHALKLDQARPVDDTSIIVLRVMAYPEKTKVRRMSVRLPFGP